ncbi:MAG: hypothetical protein QOI98_271 [Solirubrobacteraceae bacterium]|nr:hypothetical protein [Solirubrobacteraceae bacterium]
MESFIRFVAIAASLLVVAGFAAFAVDELGAATKRTEAQLDAGSSPSPTPSEEKTRERHHTRVRKWVDDANDVLLTPVAWVSDGSGNRWVRRGVPALLALALYGFGLGYVARFAHGRAR